MICYVVYDTNEISLNLETPLCLKYFSILEILINRWTPNENRDEKINNPSTSCASIQDDVCHKQQKLRDFGCEFDD